MKRRLMDAAVKEFAKHGYESASLNRILDAASMSKGSFYYYFDDKADLAAVVIEQIADEVWPTPSFPKPDDAASFWTVMDAWQRGALDAILKSPEKTEAITRLGASMSRDAELAKRIAPLIAEKSKDFVPLMQRGQELGVVRRDVPAHALIAIVGSVKEAIGRTMLPADRAISKEEYERIAALIMDLFKRISRPE